MKLAVVLLSVAGLGLADRHGNCDCFLRGERQKDLSYTACQSYLDATRRDKRNNWDGYSNAFDEGVFQSKCVEMNDAAGATADDVD
ncbi:hypothetical protein E4U42_002245 [Claviceps africana]|uniref:Secreted protein n=1 Tax=Claviceps africana TaxID=83212 RepID=A0A8K0J8L8_9HYPO|nr:hypothetical protein E4U42_002245 [Claviceps africana]